MGTIYRNGIEYPGASSKGYLIYSRMYPVRYNSSTSKWVYDSGSSIYNKVLYDTGGFSVEVDESYTSDGSILRFRVLTYTTLYNYPNYGEYYRATVSLLKVANGYDSPVISNNNWAVAVQADRVNMFIQKAERNQDKFPLELRGLTEEKDWTRVVLLIDFYGQKLTLKSGV